MTGGARESAYFLTVFLAMPRRETPGSLAWCTAFHKACFRGVASLGGGVSDLVASSSSWRWAAAASRAASRCSYNLVRPCWLRFLTTWASSGVGAKAPWAARSALALGGASW